MKIEFQFICTEPAVMAAVETATATVAAVCLCVHSWIAHIHFTHSFARSQSAAHCHGYIGTTPHHWNIELVTKNRQEKRQLKDKETWKQKNKKREKESEKNCMRTHMHAHTRT